MKALQGVSLEQEVPEKENRTTGIPVLDDAVGGGLLSGSVVYVCADAKSMAELFLYRFANARKTYYFSTDRRPLYIARDIENLGLKTDGITFVDIFSEYYLTPHGEFAENAGNEIIDTRIVEFTEYNLKNLIAEAGEDIYIVFDSFSFYLSLNVNPGIIKRLGNLIYETTKSLNCISFLYGIKGMHKREFENELLKSCDVIFDIDLQRDSDRMYSSLSIPKVRNKPIATLEPESMVLTGVMLPSLLL